MAHKHWKLVEEDEPKHGKCEHCGYCSCCGRGQTFTPSIPYTPYYPLYPYYPYLTPWSGGVWSGAQTVMSPGVSFNGFTVSANEITSGRA